MIEGASDRHVWAERFDRDLTDIFAVQDEITKTIVEQLKVKLLPEERASIEDAPTQNVEAYTTFLKGKQIFRIGTRLSLVKARQMYARALELDRLTRKPISASPIARPISNPSMAPTSPSRRYWRPSTRRCTSIPASPRPMPHAASPLPSTTGERRRRRLWEGAGARPGELGSPLLLRTLSLWHWRLRRGLEPVHARHGSAAR